MDGQAQLTAPSVHWRWLTSRVRWRTVLPTSIDLKVPYIVPLALGGTA